MRNSFLIGISISFLAFIVLFVSGCGPDQQAKRDLTVGYDALEAQQYDQALAAADAYLHQRPNGAGTAEALYLRGRALEQGHRQLVPGDDPPGGPGEVFENVVLEVRQGDGRAVDEDLAGPEDQTESAHLQGVRPGHAAARTAEHGPDAGQEHVGPERLG